MNAKIKHWMAVALALSLTTGLAAPASADRLLELDVNQEYTNVYENWVFLDFWKIFDGEYDVDDWRNDKFDELYWNTGGGACTTHFYDGAVGYLETMQVCVGFKGVSDLPVLSAEWSGDAGTPVATAGAPLGGGVNLTFEIGVTHVDLVFRNDWAPQFVDPATIYATGVKWAFATEPYTLAELNSDLYDVLTWYDLPNFSLATGASTTTAISRGFWESGYVLVGFETALANGTLGVSEIWQARVDVQTLIPVDCDGWESGATILGAYGNLVDPTNVSGPQDGDCGDCSGGTYICPGACEGLGYLHVAEEPHYGTPQAYLAWITNLTDGDVIIASFYGYDDTPGASPSLRLYAHYTTSDDIENYQGSAGGLTDYTAGTGWDFLENTWIFDSGGRTRDALVIEARLYSTPSTGEYRTDFWIDYICVAAPEHATVIFPETATPIEDATWTRVKALYR